MASHFINKFIKKLPKEVFNEINTRTDSFYLNIEDKKFIVIKKFKPNFYAIRFVDQYPKAKYEFEHDDADLNIEPLWEDYWETKKVIKEILLKYKVANLYK